MVHVIIAQGFWHCFTMHLFHVQRSVFQSHLGLLCVKARRSKLRHLHITPQMLLAQLLVVQGGTVVGEFPFENGAVLRR